MSSPPPLRDRTPAELAVLVREYLLAGHMIDRAGMPQLIARFGTDGMQEVAVAEWMAASPVYTRRMQRALGFEGDDVTTIFKGMQLDIGAPPQFMDFRYRVHDRHHGEFWLDHCGALMDVEPMGDELVVAMCHHIEDPTFDATACATNPRARMLPVHRPPRRPADRHPHCHWTVVVDPAADPLPEPEGAVRLAASRAGRVALAPPAGDDRPGRRHYGGELEADLRFEELAPATLVHVAEEVCLQGHLLSLAFAAAVADRAGLEAATEVGVQQLVGVAGLTADRLRRALGLEPSLAAVAEVVELHPAFLPRAYVDVRVELDGDRVVVELADCEALREDLAPTWPVLAVGAGERVLAAVAGGVDPRARVEATAHDGPGATWHVTLGDGPLPEPDEVLLTRFSTGAAFAFADR